MLRAINNHRPCLALIKSMLKQLISAATPSSWLLTSLVRPLLVAPLSSSYAYVAAFASEYEINLRGTTSAVNTLSLAPCSSHSSCCNQHLVGPDYCLQQSVFLHDLDT